MLECVTGRRCFGSHSKANALRCQSCPDIFRCVKYEVDRLAYHEWILKKHARGSLNG